MKFELREEMIWHWMPKPAVCPYGVITLTLNHEEVPPAKTGASGCKAVRRPSSMAPLSCPCQIRAGAPSAADFNGDRMADIAWRRTDDAGEVRIWFPGGSARAQNSRMTWASLPSLAAALP